MSIEAPPSNAIGNPVQRESLLRSMRSNTVAAVLTGWTVLIVAIGIVVLGNQIGFTRPFQAADAVPELIGIQLGQWWVTVVVAGMFVLSSVLGCAMTAANGEQRRIVAWNTTLVRPGRLVLGLWKSQLALDALALVLALPVAGIAYGFGGVTLAQLGIGLGGAAVAGVTMSAFAIAVSCRAQRVVRPLAVCLVVVAALLVGPLIAHQVRGAPDTDPALAVVPMVAVSDAAVPHGPTRISVADAPNQRANGTTPPMTRMYESVEPTSGSVPLWGWSAIGAAVITLGSLIVTRIRIARPPGH